MRRSLPLLLGSIVLVLAACSDQGPAPATNSQSLGRTIQLGPHFFFLPPLAKTQPKTGDFHPGLAPVVEICRLTAQNGSCTPTDSVIRFTTAAPGQFGEIITVNGSQEFYGVGWNTSLYQLPNYTYWRITVRTAPGGGTVFGFLDIWLAKAANELKNTPPGNVGVLNTSNVPIKFRLEEGALCGQPNCVEGSFTSSGGTFTTQDGTAGLQAPEGALDPGVAVNLVIERYHGPDPCLPVFDPQYEGCYRYYTEPHIEEFNLPLILGQCLDTAGQAVYNELALWKWDEVNENTLVELPAADASAFITCPEDLASAPQKTGFLAGGLKLLKPLASVFVKPLHAKKAGPPPLGAGALDLSRVGPRRQLSMTKVSGDSQTVIIGTNVFPTVKVTSTKTGNPVSGVPVDFTVLSGGGSATTPVVTDAFGLAASTWTMGLTPGVNTVQADGNNPRPIWPGQPGVFATATFTATAIEPNWVAFFNPPIGVGVAGANELNLTPTVRVCELVGTDCGTILFSQAATLAVDGTQYQAGWNTPSTLSTLKVYRIDVIVGTKTIGSIEVRPVEGGKFKTGNYEFNAGQNVPVKFKIQIV